VGNARASNGRSSKLVHGTKRHEIVTLATGGMLNFSAAAARWQIETRRSVGFARAALLSGCLLAEAGKPCFSTRLPSHLP
jgi:hypothetical protein